jgi:hypothetical protein
VCNTLCGCFTAVLSGILEATPITEIAKLLKEQTKEIK